MLHDVRLGGLMKFGPSSVSQHATVHNARIFCSSQVNCHGHQVSSLAPATSVLLVVVLVVLVYLIPVIVLGILALGDDLGACPWSVPGGAVSTTESAAVLVENHPSVALIDHYTNPLPAIVMPVAPSCQVLVPLLTLVIITVEGASGVDSVMMTSPIVGTKYLWGANICHG